MHQGFCYHVGIDTDKGYKRKFLDSIISREASIKMGGLERFCVGKKEILGRS